LSFADPATLLLLLIVAALATLPVVAWSRRRRATERFGRPDLLGTLMAAHPGAWRATRSILLILTLALLVVALARPLYGSETRTLRQRGIDVVIALDFSKSMLARDVSPSRIERAKAELIDLLHELEGDRIGLVAFAGDTIEFPMTEDATALALFLRDLMPYDMPVGGTAIGRALTASKRLLERSRPDRPTGEASQRSQVVILITDGEDHEGDPRAAAAELAEAGIQIYAIGVGTRSGEPIPTYGSDGTWTGYLRGVDGETVMTAFKDENAAILRELAEATTGQYVATKRGEIGIAAIRQHLRGLKQEIRKSRQVTVFEERYAWALALAFLLLLVEGFLPQGTPRPQISRGERP